MRFPSASVLLVALSVSPLALAQGGDKASAELLFNEGRSLLQQGNVELACEKLAESQRLDPAVGTLLNLADCQERLGRTASAWATWLEAAALARSAGQADRESHARQRAQSLAPRLVTLTVEVPPEHRVEGLSIKRNTLTLGPALWGTAAPVDPGQYEISAQAPGHQSWTTPISVREGTPARIVVPRLTPEPAAAAGPAAPGPAGVAPEPSRVDSSARANSGPSPLVYVLGGVGVVGLGVGTLFGLSAMSKNEDSKEDCERYTLCSQRGVDLRDDAYSAATISTIGFAAGAVGLAAAAVLWITSTGSEEAAAAGVRIPTFDASADAHGARIGVRGAF